MRFISPLAVLLCCISLQTAAAQKLTGNLTSGITCTTGEQHELSGLVPGAVVLLLLFLLMCLWLAMAACVCFNSSMQPGFD